VEWLKVQALSSNPSTTKKKKINTNKKRQDYKIGTVRGTWRRRKVNEGIKVRDYG
jgi:hypothetical protein